LGNILEFLKRFLEEFYWEIIFLILFVIIGAVYLFGRNKIRKRLLLRKVAPKVKEVISVYEKEILPDYVEAKPKIIVAQQTKELPKELPFGYIFVPEGQEELMWNTLIAYVPLSCSLKKIKLLFDEPLRKSLFDVLSYELGMRLEKENLAVTYRDHGLREYRDDFKTMEQLYEDKKLTTIILLEASLRLRKSKGHISSSDMEEFSTLVRKIAKIDAVVLRVGIKYIPVEEIIASKRGVVLLARGANILRAIAISEKLQENGYTKIPETELGLANPEQGIWHFEYPKVNDVPFMRIWLKPADK